MLTAVNTVGDFRYQLRGGQLSEGFVGAAQLGRYYSLDLALSAINFDKLRVVDLTSRVTT
ncbi:hypothetical protein SAMN03080615_02799 [Amphritea atlantica]|uniref:Uncharacterized protein n=1 Tax=Amphritea atlantica TaxID=355243 RepID=A0A1H9J0G1_9GAMM|nr:hypothetical protein SAMN03080615_02799 [Amphritea atlantica]